MQKNFEDITINEICQTANIRRATFYKHFSDKYAFLKFFVGSLRQDFDRKLKQRGRSQSYYVEYIRGIVDFLIENERMIKNVLNSEVLLALVEVIKEKNYEDTCEKLTESKAEGLALHASIEVTAAMMTGAVAETILWWYRSDKKLPKEVLIEQISALIERMS